MCSVAQLCLTLWDPTDHNLPGSSVMEFPRQKYWSGLPFPLPGDLPDPGIEPLSPALAGRFFTTEPPGKPLLIQDLCSAVVIAGFPGGSVVKNLPANAGDRGSSSGSRRSPGGGNGNPILYSCLGIPWTEEPGGLQSMELQRVRHNQVTNTFTYTYTYVKSN